MLIEKMHKAFALLAAVILAAGLVTHGFAGPDLASKSGMRMAGDLPMSNHMPMPGKCNGCAGDENGMTSSACSALCGTVIALPSMMLVPDAAPAEELNPAVVSDLTGHADPPQPYPPRTTVLS
jgi:hypothetical protein